MARLAKPRKRLRRLAFGLSTVLGGPRRGVFIPYRYADGLPSAGRRDAYPAAGAVLRVQESAFAELLERIEGFSAELSAIGGDSAPPAPRWNQSWFPRLDAAAAYALVRSRTPRRILEIGSGHSTRVLARAAADGGFDCSITCVDPQPRATLDGLPVSFRQGTLQQIGTQVIDDLGPGDLLFVDSSHVLVPGSDVELVLSELLPRLPQGVLLHVHDVFLPDDYPQQWTWRAYNEQGGVATLLGAGWRPVFASYYALTRMRERTLAGVVGRLPKPEDALETSLWLEKTVPAAA